MCLCTPTIRTPYCGKLGCEWPGQRPEGARTTSDEVEAIKRMTPDQLAKAIANLSPADRAKLDERLKGFINEQLAAANDPHRV